MHTKFLPGKLNGREYIGCAWEDDMKMDYKRYGIQVWSEFK
jgi:hypothetical protein